MQHENLQSVIKHKKPAVVMTNLLPQLYHQAHSTAKHRQSLTDLYHVYMWVPGSRKYIINHRQSHIQSAPSDKWYAHWSCNLVLYTCVWGERGFCHHCAYGSRHFAVTVRIVSIRNFDVVLPMNDTWIFRTITIICCSKTVFIQYNLGYLCTDKQMGDGRC